MKCDDLGAVTGLGTVSVTPRKTPMCEGGVTGPNARLTPKAVIGPRPAQCPLCAAGIQVMEFS
jgi:hypothetical protein